jgi:hypothetical protein
MAREIESSCVSNWVIVATDSKFKLGVSTVNIANV